MTVGAKVLDISHVSKSESVKKLEAHDHKEGGHNRRQNGISFDHLVNTQWICQVINLFLLFFA